jgi:phage-related protein
MPLKPIRWMGDSRRRLQAFPKAVRYEIGQALYQAELSGTHPSVSPMRGMSVVEIVSDYSGDTYRGIYTTKFKGQVYVLHCFKKKSTIGIKTPTRDLELIRKRLSEARLHFKGMV